MKYPQAAKPLKTNDAKLGGKYRMSKVRSFIALAYLLYLWCGKRSSVDYSDCIDGKHLQLKEKYLEKLRDFFGIDADSVASNNPLLDGQFEYILVTMERIFRLGSVRFNDSSYNNSKERTGGIRYPKTLLFSTNMFVLDLIISGFEDEVKRTCLKEWLQSKKASNSDFEEKVTQYLTICSELTLFKVRIPNGEEIVYRPIGIYEQLILRNEVSIDDSKEQVGTSSIYKNVLKEELNPWLNSQQTNGIKLNSNRDITSYVEMVRTSLDITKVGESEISTRQVGVITEVNEKSLTATNVSPLVTAIRTKPFLLLAGISGTGKSRIVREFAFKSCPKCLQDKDGTTPGNYCMIEVKPNWHDSTELLGYYSNLSKGYQFKKFVKFLVKAKMFPKVPFFVCLDEMNLAPVEQYFAELLSILETRKHPKDSETGEVNMSTIKTEAIVEARHFHELSKMSNTRNVDTGKAYDQRLTDREIYMKLYGMSEENAIAEEMKDKTELTTIGLTLPDNVVIIGTVNMDDTTHQFSRKVIDRSMTIEMNGGKLADMYGRNKDLEYLDDEFEQQKWQHAFVQRYVTADEVLQAHPTQAEEIKNKLPLMLEGINQALRGTPFEVSYRVLNELTVMVGVMLDEKNDETGLDDIINQAVNNILLMKILPRIEGDAEMFALSKDYKNKVGVPHNNRLEWLKELAPDVQNVTQPGQETDGESGEQGVGVELKDRPQTAKEKIQEMVDRLNNQDFTRFWP